MPIRGPLVADHVARRDEGAAAMAAWPEGRLRFGERIDMGIETALPAFLRRFDGSDDGKMILRIGQTSK